MNPTKHNQQAWDKKAEDGSRYTKSVSSEVIKRSRSGQWSISVTTDKPVPRAWFPEILDGLEILCLASGGGQQAPVLAAAGANVTVTDLSRKQLDQDEAVAKRDGLKLTAVQANMTDLRMFGNDSFDLIVHPVSNLFVDDVQPVWLEAARVLKRGGQLIAGFTNPLLWIFDDAQEQQDILDVKHSIPSSTLDRLATEEERRLFEQTHETIEYAHTLESQIQGQINAGFAITGFYEDDFGRTRILDTYIKSFIATKAIKV